MCLLPLNMSAMQHLNGFSTGLGGGLKLSTNNKEIIIITTIDYNKPID